MKSKNHLKAILGWLWVFILSLFYSMPLVLFATWKTFQGFSWTQAHPIAYLQIVLCLAILVLILISWLINKWIRAKKWDENGMLRLAVLAIFTVFLVMFNMDDRKINNDYTWDDVPNPPRAEESYGSLLEVFGQDAKSSPPLKLPTDMEAVFKDPLAHKTEIEKWWQEAKAARQVLAKLDTHEAIGDLTKVEEITLLQFAKTKNVFRVIQSYGLLQIAEGHPETGISNLRQCQSIVRKSLPFSRYLINKMLWTASASNNIHAAYHAVLLSNGELKTLRILRDEFKPLMPAELNIQRTFISEYLFAKNYKGNSEVNQTFLGNAFWPFIFKTLCFYDENSATAWEKFISSLFYYGTFRKNRWLGTLKIYYAKVITAAEKQLPDLAGLKQFECSYSANPDFRNIGGWMIRVNTEPMSHYLDMIMRAKVKSDLFAFHLSHKLGECTKLKDFYTGIDYRLDEKLGARSAGPDGQFNTEDDITLDVISGK